MECGEKKTNILHILSASCCLCICKIVDLLTSCVYQNKYHLRLLETLPQTVVVYYLLLLKNRKKLQVRFTTVLSLIFLEKVCTKRR